MPSGDVHKITLLLETEDDQLRVRAEAPGGEAKGEGALPDATAIDEIAEYNPAELPKGVLSRVGRALWDSLSVGNVNELMFDTLQDAGEQKETVQVELRFDPDQVKLTAYPWEMLCNANGQFLVRDGLIDLTRYITYPQNPPRFDQRLADLPLLRIISSPPNLQPINAAVLNVDPMVQLLPATFDEFMKRLLLERKSMWALQFDGHGALVKLCPNCETANEMSSIACYKCRKSLEGAETCGALAFEDATGTARWIPTTEFGSMLYNANIPIALLLACESAMTGGDLVFNGVAPGLLLAGVPAVIGMQYEVTNQFANNFANTFYAMLDTGKSLLESLRLARRMNIGEAWYSPVLYLRYRRTEAEERQLPPISEARKVDTAVPGHVGVGVDFLARCWIRRPDTKALTRAELADMLGTKDEVSISVRDDQDVQVDLKPVEGRKLRRGEVIVKLQSPKCTVTPESIKLFVDEQIDAPPAFFTVRAQQTGKIALIFSIIQDGTQIHTVVHTIDATEQQAVAVGAALQQASSTVPVMSGAAIQRDPMAGPSLPKPIEITIGGNPSGSTSVAQGGVPEVAAPARPGDQRMDEKPPETERVNRDEYYRQREALEAADRAAEEAVDAELEELEEEAEAVAPPPADMDDAPYKPEEMPAPSIQPEQTMVDGIPKSALPSDMYMGGAGDPEPAEDDTAKEAVPPMYGGAPSEPDLDQTIERPWNEANETKQHPTAARPSAVPPPPPPPPSSGPAPSASEGARPGTGYDYAPRPEPSYATPTPEPAYAAPAAPRKARSPLPAIAGAMSAFMVIFIVGALVVGGNLLNNPTSTASQTQIAMTSIAEVTKSSMEADMWATETALAVVVTEDTAQATPTATNIPVDPAALAAKTAVQNFDEVRQNALQTWDVQKVEQVSAGVAQRTVFAEVSDIQQRECLWKFDDRGLGIETVTFSEDRRTATVDAIADRDGVLNCGGDAAERFKGPVRYNFVVELIEDRWIVTNFEEIDHQ